MRIRVACGSAARIGLLGLALVMLGGAAAAQTPAGVEVGNNLQVTEMLARNSTYRFELTTQADARVNMWSGTTADGTTARSPVNETALRDVVTAMRAAIAQCNEKRLSDLKLHALGVLEYMTAGQAEDIARRAAVLARLINGVQMTCGGRTYAADGKARQAREVFNRAFTPVLQRIQADIQRREEQRERAVQQQGTVQQGPPSPEDILSEIEENEKAEKQQKASEKKSSRKESKSVRGKPERKKVVTVTGGKSSKIGRNAVPIDISKATPPPSGGVPGLEKPQAKPGTVKIRGTTAPAQANASPPGLSENAAYAVEIENEGSRLLARLQAIRGCRPDIDFFPLLIDWSRRANHLYSVPGVRQLMEPIWSEYQRVHALPLCPPPPVRINLTGRATSTSVPQINGGTVFSGGGEKPILLGPHWLHGGGGAFDIEVPMEGIHLKDAVRFGSMRFFLRGAFDSVDGTSSGGVAAGTDNVAQTYIFPNPASGSTGVNAGATGQSVSIDSRVLNYDAIAGIRYVMSGQAMEDFLLGREASVGIHYRHMRRTDTINQQGIGFPDLYSSVDLGATANFVGPDFGTGIQIMPAGPSGFFGGLHGMIAPGVLFTGADASQTSHCGPCGGASPEFDVSLSRDFSDSRFSVIAGAHAEIGYQFNPAARISLFANYEVMTGAPVLNVPTTPAQQPVGLDHGSAESWQVGAKLNWVFGGVPR